MKKCSDALGLDPGASDECDAPEFQFPPTAFSTELVEGDVNIDDWNFELAESA